MTQPRRHIHIVTDSPSLLLAAVSAAAAAAVTASHREEREPKLASVLSPHLSVFLFFTLFVDDGFLIMWKVRGQEVEDEEDVHACFVF